MNIYFYFSKSIRLVFNCHIHNKIVLQFQDKIGWGDTLILKNVDHKTTGIFRHI